MDNMAERQAHITKLEVSFPNFENVTELHVEDLRADLYSM
jgi:hypothetical protein